jgi:DNA polymerase-3 subunit delta
MSTFKSTYLIHGDDHGRIGERRARLRALAERDGGAGCLEVLEGADATAAAAGALLGALTLAIGRRFIIVDGVERWKEDEGRAKAPAALHRAVIQAGGDVAAEMSVKEWDLPAWVLAQATAAGLTLDQHGARTLVAIVGSRQARLAREIEKLALECGPGSRLDADGVAERVGRSAERKAWTLADAVVARDTAAATRIYLALRTQGERVESLTYWVTRRLREALGVAARLEAGAPPSAVRGDLRMPPKAASAFVADVARTDVGSLRRAIAALADLELETRGGSALDADTLALRTLGAITA